MEASEQQQNKNERFLYPCVFASKEEVECMFDSLQTEYHWAYPEGYGDFRSQWFIPEEDQVRPIEGGKS